MKILNFGSLNIDRVFQVDHFVRPGETLGSDRYAENAGGKGANQSAALALAGADVYHAGRVGKDGEWLLSLLREKGVNTTLTAVGEVPTGQAVIQVDRHGENAIILQGGANRALTAAQIPATLAQFAPGDVLLLQNEISCLEEIINVAAARGLAIWFNPAPFAPEVLRLPLAKISTIIVNETEARGVAELDEAESTETVITTLQKKYPTCDIMLTLGAQGAEFIPAAHNGSERVFVPARKTVAVDTTAAGDTFIGYFLAARARGENVRAAMELATTASSICVSRAGALTAIPALAEVEELLRG